ncbi:MAG: hydrogenase formation protein HypD [Planctomycetota bacterium]|nr:hydrogenase formation protein HypD [Planctomycetota bacterium]
MKYVDEYRRPDVARALVDAVRAAATRRWTIMEVCGGQTHAILRAGLDELLAPAVELVHGPGCPVCVTPVELIDQAHAIASTPGVVLTSFGDMLRVPGSADDLLRCRARGADVRVVYSPLDALRLARELPARQVVFFAVGFETTAPATAVAVQQARRLGVMNFSVLCAHVRVPPAIEAVLQRPGRRVQGFLGPGHVCTVVGLDEYRPLAARYRVPIVVSGFEPVDLLEGTLRCVRQLEAGRHEVENQYSRVVPDGGNARSLALLADVFEAVDRPWRGIGSIPRSGLRLADAYADLDAARRFDVTTVEARESPLCISGRVLAGDAKPTECPAFGTECTPERPLGATMVSAEGACAAYHAYGRRPPAAAPR